MNEHTNITGLPVVQIAGTDVRRITYRGEPVVTFAMVDEIHQRADGTAGRNFRENRDRFNEGEDFLELTSDEIRRMSAEGVFPPRTARGTILTQRGYLKLVKPMNDDRAWQVQGEMIDRYFMIESVAAVRSAPVSGTAVAREARLTMTMFMGLAEKCGLKGNQLVLSANQATRKLTGVDCMSALGVSHLDSPQQAVLLTPSDIGARLGLTAQVVNKGLTTYDYQTAHQTKKRETYYELTEKGLAAGGTFSDTGKKHNDGTPVRQLRWPSTIVKPFATEMGVLHGL